MSLLNMSFAAAVLIGSIVIIRALLLYKLPIRLFLILWSVVLCRLLVPFEISSRFSIYSMINTLKGSITKTNLSLDEMPTAPKSVSITSTGSTLSQVVDVTINPVIIFWLIGFAVFVLIFLITHLRWRKEYKTALPVDNTFIKHWQLDNSIRRKVIIRQSDKIYAPLTYGIFCPIILLPKRTNWEDEDQLHYILAHEFVHIRRFDTLTKLVMVVALCVHWFNPFVWLMYVLANRDIELSCDEAVIRTFGETAKSAYALTLIGLEEKKIRLTPLENHFSKNSLEERIFSIMKIKKISLVAVLVTMIMIVGVTMVFATSEAKSNQSPFNNTKVSNIAKTIKTTNTEKTNDDKVIHYSAPGTDNNHSSYSENDYEALMSLKTDGYRELNVSEFDSMAEKILTIYNGYNPNDENVDFMRTLFYSTIETTFSFNNETPLLSVGTGINKETSNKEYYGAELSYEIHWTIVDKANTTVGQRDDILNECQNSIQSILEGKSKDLLENLNIRTQLQSEYDTLADELSNDFISVQITILSYSTVEDYFIK